MAPPKNCFTCNFITTLENAIISMKDTKKIMQSKKSME